MDTLVTAIAAHTIPLPAMLRATVTITLPNGRPFVMEKRTWFKFGDRKAWEAAHAAMEGDLDRTFKHARDTDRRTVKVWTQPIGPDEFGYEMPCDESAWREVKTGA